jgi:BMFP domain-containing protein YqiC
MGHDDSNTRRPSSLFERLTQGEDPLFNQIDRNAKSLLQSALSRLDVVSREEFDAQTAVLQRTRERLEALEKQIEMLDQTLETPPDKAGQ